MSFKVGERVRGLPSASKHYTVTVKGWEGKVTGVFGKNHIEVDGYDVDPRHFRRIGGKAERVNFVVFYDEDDHDPMKEFHSEAEIKRWLKEAHEDDDIEFSSIRIFKVDHELAINTSFRLTKKRA